MSGRIAEVIARARADGDPAALLGGIPYARFLGINVALDDEGLYGVMTFQPDLVGNAALPALHGGTLGALLESTAIAQVLWQADTVVLPRTINLTVDYLRSAGAVDTFARAQITRLGRRVANVRAEAWQDDRSRLIASATAHFLITSTD